MEYIDAHLPTAFRKQFEAGKESIAQAQEAAQRIGYIQPLGQTVGEQLDLLTAISPALVNECLSYARMLESQLEALVGKRKVEGLLDEPAVFALLDTVPSKIRQYHFVGELALTLDYFGQQFLAAVEQAQLCETIARQGLAAEQALQCLLGHVINEVLFDSKERLALRLAADSLAALRHVLATPRKPGGLLKADYTVRRRQFIARAGWLCLRLYGHVTTHIMVQLLASKKPYYLAGHGIEDDEGGREATINRELSKLRGRARKRSVAEDWETAAVVKAFFAKSHWKGG